MRFRMMLRAWLCAALLASALSSPVAAAAGDSDESAVVSEEIRAEMGQEPGPIVDRQGGAGGTSEPHAPAGGELIAGQSTEFSDTWRVPRRGDVTRISAAPVNFK